MNIQSSLGSPEDLLDTIESDAMVIAQDFSYYALVGVGAVLLIKAFTGK